MAGPNAQKDFYVDLQVLHSLTRSADLSPALAFITLLSRALSRSIEEGDAPPTEILLPRSVKGDIMMLGPILDSGAWDVYFDWDSVQDRAAILPRLTRVLDQYKTLTRRRNNYSAHRRAAVSQAKHQLHGAMKQAKKLLRRILTDAYVWHETHREKENWRKALLQLEPDLRQCILHIEPPVDAAVRRLQTEIFHEAPLRPSGFGPALGDINLEEGGWQDALCRLIPPLRTYIIFFDPPEDETMRWIETRMLWKTLYSDF